MTFVIIQRYRQKEIYSIMDAFMIKNLLITTLLEEEPEIFITYNGLTTDIFIDNIMDISIKNGEISCSTIEDIHRFSIENEEDVKNFVVKEFPYLL